MRRASVLLSFPSSEKTEAAASWSGRARLSAPHRGIRGFEPSARLRPRFLESPDANGRTLSGTSAASTSQSGTRRTGRCPSRPRAQCTAAPDENRSRSASRSTLAKASFVERDFAYVTVMETRVKRNVAILGTHRGVDPRSIVRHPIPAAGARTLEFFCGIR
jgi:hypothetical protein